VGQEILLDLEEECEGVEKWFIITIVVWRGSGEIVRSREECGEGRERWFIITIVVWRGSGDIVRSREECGEGREMVYYYYCNMTWVRRYC